MPAYFGTDFNDTNNDVDLIFRIPLTSIGEALSNTPTESQDAFSEFRPFKPAAPLVTAPFCERSVSAAPIHTSSSTQTTTSITVRATTQTAPLDTDATLDDVPPSLMLAEAALATACRRNARAAPGAALVPPPPEDGPTRTNGLADLLSLSHLPFFGTAPISALSWVHSDSGARLVVASARRAPLAGHMADIGTGAVSQIAVWTLDGSVSPTALLETPAPALCLATEASSGVLVGGLVDGRVAVWRLPDNADTSEAVYQPICLSALSESHAAPVLAAVIVPAHLHVNAAGGLVEATSLGGRVQVATTSADSQLLVWEIAQNNIRLLFSSDVSSQQHLHPSCITLADNNTSGKVTALLGTTAGALAEMELQNATENVILTLRQQHEQIRSCRQLSQLLPRAALTALAGQHLPLLSEEHRPLPPPPLPPLMLNAASVVAAAAGGDLALSKAMARTAVSERPVPPSLRPVFCSTVQVSPEAHAFPPFMVYRSPFVPSLVFSVSSDGWVIWSGNKPVCRSPPPTSPYSSACPSLSRPSVLFCGREDGCIEVWDVLDSTVTSFMVTAVSVNPITSLAYISSANIAAEPGRRPRPRDAIAAGDSTGVVAIREIARSMRQPVHGERSQLNHLLKRDLISGNYFVERDTKHTTSQLHKFEQLVREN